MYSCLNGCIYLIWGKSLWLIRSKSRMTLNGFTFLYLANGFQSNTTNEWKSSESQTGFSRHSNARVISKKFHILSCVKRSLYQVCVCWKHENETCCQRLTWTAILLVQHNQRLASSEGTCGCHIVVFHLEVCCVKMSPAQFLWGPKESKKLFRLCKCQYVNSLTTNIFLRKKK